MNERIKELFLHAFPPSLNDSALVNQSAEKFAELIVKECADIADQAEPFFAYDLILKHFGVEE